MIPRFERRILAYTIDLGLCYLLATLSYFGLTRLIDLPFFYFLIWIEIFATIIYFILFGFILYFLNGRTIGSLIFRYRIVPLNGERIRLKDCFIRSALLSLIAAVLVNAVYMLTVHSERTIFDIISKTMTITNKNKRSEYYE